MNKFLTKSQLFYLSLGGFGMAFASSLELNNTSGLFKFLGASDRELSWLWLIAPVTGLVMQPVLGQLSDSIQTRYGRRIPFIFIGMILMCLSLFVNSFSESLILTTLMIVVLSCSLNGAQEALRALTGDITPTKQKATAFAWQSIAGGIGSMLASIVPWFLDSMHIFAKQTESGTKIPIVLKLTLMIGVLVLIQTIWKMISKIKESDFQMRVEESSLSRKSKLLLFVTIWRELLVNIVRMPYVIRRFFIVQMFTWSGMYCIWLYLGLALAQHMYGLPVGADVTKNPVYQKMLGNGVIHSGICFGIYQAFSILFVLLIPKLANRFSPYKIHATALLIGAFSLASIFFLHNMLAIYAAMIGVGIFWGSVATMPYAIVSAELPADKMGTYLGIFNITVTIPQIFCGLIVGFVLQYIFFSHAIFCILLGGILIGISGIILFRQEGLDIMKMSYLWISKIIRTSLDKVQGR